MQMTNTPSSGSPTLTSTYHSISVNGFSSTMGDGDTDHYCCQRPDDMSTSIRAYKIDENKSDQILLERLPQLWKLHQLCSGKQTYITFIYYYTTPKSCLSLGISTDASKMAVWE